MNKPMKIVLKKHKKRRKKLKEEKRTRSQQATKPEINTVPIPHLRYSGLIKNGDLKNFEDCLEESGLSERVSFSQKDVGDGHIEIKFSMKPEVVADFFMSLIKGSLKKWNRKFRICE